MKDTLGTQVPNAHGASYADGWIGSKYQPGRNTRDIARDVRAEIKALVKSGGLPGAPIAYSVRTTRFAGGSAIDVTVKNATVTLVEDAWGYGYKHDAAAAALLTKLDGLLAAHKRDMSDSMVDYWDVNFYGRASYDWQTTTEVRIDRDGVETV